MGSNRLVVLPARACLVVVYIFTTHEHHAIALPTTTTCRSMYFWEHIVLVTFTPENWIENFRMNRETFEYLCAQLRPHIQRQNTRLRTPIIVEHRYDLLELPSYHLVCCLLAIYRVSHHRPSLRRFASRETMYLCLCHCARYLCCHRFCTF